MATDETTRASLRRLTRSLSLTWAAAWLIGLGLLAAVAIDQAGRLQTLDLDARLALHGMAVYGLGWYDEQGEYHAEMLERELVIVESEFDTWVVQPGEPLKLNLAPAVPRFVVRELAELTAQVMESHEDLLVDLAATDGTALRVHVGPTFLDDEDVAANGAIVVVGDRTSVLRDQKSFAARLLLFTAALGLAGLLVGIVLSHRSVRPVTRALDQRERFITAAAHELRSPVASLAAVCDSARAGDEPAVEAMERVATLVEHTGRVVDDLLLYARLEAGGTALERQSLRLDLLVEACLTDDSAIQLVAAEPVTLEADDRLLRAAVRLLLGNAAKHGGPEEQHIRVVVSASGVSVEDSGPGFTAEVLERSRGAFARMPSSSGAGLGLAIARMIAELHDGALVLGNRSEGGARAELRLGSRG